MLSSTETESVPGVTLTSVILIAAIAVGALLGYFVPDTGKSLGNSVDYTLLAMVGLLFFGVRFGDFFQAAKNLRFLVIALLANFVLVPLIGYGVASLFLSSHPLLLVGLLIYFMAPCTDWFLSFTRLSGGNVALGATLIPINMAVQLLLYPIYLHLFTQNSAQVEAGTIGYTLLQWFLLPLLAAITLHQLFRRFLNSDSFESLLEKADQATLWVTALLVLQIFAGNISAILAHLSVFIWVLLAVFTFFLVTFMLVKGLSHFFQLGYQEHALLTMTTAARNAPMMLAVTMAALPDQPLIYAALLIGMLVEIPHLTLLRHALLSSRGRHQKKDALALG